MVKFIFTNCLGNHVFNNNYKYAYSDKDLKTIEKKTKDARPIPPDKIVLILDHFRDKSYFDAFYKENILRTKEQLQNVVSDDQLITQAISTLEDLKHTINTLANRVIEWYSWYCPELSENIDDPEKIIPILISSNKDQILKKLNLKESIGSSLKKADLSPIISIALQISNLYKLLKTQETYLEQCMNRYCPNITAITGSLIGAKLLNQAGSLKHLSEFPSSTIQLLGAEKALFRHLKTGANSPRYGFLHEHPLLAKSKKKIQGKVARALADKIAIAAKVDYFKGKPIGEKLRKSLEAKFK